jgi:hypothetical protein
MIIPQWAEGAYHYYEDLTQHEQGLKESIKKNLTSAPINKALR